MPYNIALVPIESERQKFIDYAKTLSSSMADTYLIGANSLPHVTLCHFEVTPEKLESVIKQFESYAQTTLALTFTSQRNKTYIHPKWGQWSWVSLMPNHLDILENMHLAMAQIVKPTNAAGKDYDPHLTLFNSLYTNEVHRVGCEAINAKPALSQPLAAMFELVLGDLDEVGQITKIIRNFHIPVVGNATPHTGPSTPNRHQFQYAGKKEEAEHPSTVVSSFVKRFTS